MNFEDIIAEETGALPLYKRVAEGLRRNILNGTLPDGLRLPPEAELADRMGVSHLTLRKGLKILSNQGLLSQRQRCGTFISNRKVELHRIGLVINSRDADHDRYLQRLISNLSQRLLSNVVAGMGELVLLPIKAADPLELMRRINQSGCEALLVALYHEEFNKMLCAPEFAHFDKVFIGAALDFPEGRECFVSRQAPGAITAAVEYLLELRHRRIAYLSSSLGYESLTQRNREFLDVRDRFGLDADPALLLLDNGLEWYEFARRAAAALCRSANRPDAILCPGITFACGAWQGVMDAHLRIPEDISLLGFDADPVTNPGMSGIESPLDDILERAVNLLFDQFRLGKHLKQRIYEFPAKIVERGSCRMRQGVTVGKESR